MRLAGNRLAIQAVQSNDGGLRGEKGATRPGSQGNREVASRLADALTRIARGDGMTPRRLGEVVRRLRTERGLTQVELAMAASITQSYLAQLEGGERENPSLDVLKRLANALGVPPTELLE
jgi:DNA-binding XRE family transcriptional regulator